MSLDHPSYLGLYAAGELASRAAQARGRLSCCDLCAHGCHADRRGKGRGVCRAGGEAVVSSYGPHFGEEDVLVGRRGSGTVFFAGCNLGCVFCQNWEISHGRQGEPRSAGELGRIFLAIQAYGCHNLNLVTPTPHLPAILTAHFAAAKEAIREMHRQVGDLEIGGDGVARRGLLVRHLVLPGDLAHSEQVFHFLAEEVSADTYINIMAQYRPAWRAREHPPLERRLAAEEYREVVRMAKKVGLWRISGDDRECAAWLCDKGIGPCPVPRAPRPPR